MLTILRTVDKITSVLLALGGLACMLMAVQVTANVAGRNALNQPVPGTLEIVSSWWLPLTVFLAIGAAQRADEHVRVTVLTEKLPRRARTVVDVATLLVSGLTILTVTYYAYQSARSSVEIRETIAGTVSLPLWPIKIVALFGLCVYLLQIIATVYRMVRGEPTVNEVGSQDHDA